MLDEATATFLSQMAESQPDAKPMHEMTPSEARGMMAMMTEFLGSGPEMARVENVAVPSAAGAKINMRVLIPKEESPAGVIVYYHGGGWVIGRIEEFDTLGRMLAARTKCAVVLVDYRLAPEHRFPTAVHDSYAGLEWTAKNIEQIAGKRVPIIVAGDSAGGNLAAVVVRQARDHAGPTIHLQALIYPVTDANFETPSYHEPENQLLLTRDSMLWFWDHYVPNTQDRLHPDASPLRATDLSELPPAIVITSEHDPLRDEGEAYAARLSDAGVAVKSRRFEGQMHGFFTMVNVLPGSEQALDYLARSIDEHLA